MYPLSEQPLLIPQGLERAILKAFIPSGRDGGILATLWPTLARGRGKVHVGTVHYGDRADEARIYGLYYLTANVLKLTAILNEAQLLGLPISGPLRLLDLGCGPGTALAGALTWASSSGLDVGLVAGFDRSSEFLKLSQRLVGEMGSAFESVRGDLVDTKIVASTIARLKPTLVTASNALSEIPGAPHEKMQLVAAWVKEIASLSEKDGVSRTLILIEPGSKEASRELHEVRRLLLADEGFNKNASVVLPCLDARPCGALVSATDWCHESINAEFPEWHTRLGHSAGLKKEQLLFSYIVIRIGSQSRVPADWHVGALRMVSQRLVEKGLVKCFLCTTGGKKLARVLDARVTPENQVIRQAQRGQIFTSAEIDEKGNVTRAQELSV